MNKIMNWQQFNESAQEDEPKSEVQAEVRAAEKKMKPKTLNKYQQFFKAKLKKYEKSNLHFGIRNDVRRISHGPNQGATQKTNNH